MVYTRPHGWFTVVWNAPVRPLGSIGPGCATFDKRMGVSHRSRTFIP